MKLLIIGSRGIEEYDFGKYIPKETTMIITGDRLAGRKICG